MKASSTKKKTPVKTEIKENSFPVVAIGASAGGLEAMMELLKYLPADTGMAYIFVQHLSPDHKSMLTEILSKKTKMKVQEIDDMDKIKPNHVFVIPYNKGIEVTDGHIKLISRSSRNVAISIDILFSSLAEAQKERVIGIILSGSASDGAMGMKTIKQEGGLTFAQDDTAQFTSMPHSAIATGAVDFVLPPKEIALELARLSKHPLIKIISVKNGEEDLIENSNPDLKIILNLLYKATNVDFSVYKMNTIKRRIIRRMLLYKITKLKEYAKFLSQKKEEINLLYQDLLINVTSFFRDPETHNYLKENLFPKLLKRKKSGEVLRIWIPACATGEEAYSIAMMFLEIHESKITNPPVQIFATDLSEQAISKARNGTYTKQDLGTLSPKRIQRFFTASNGDFHINKAVRAMCVFAPHNLLHDPPFSRLDFISCCNLFIYLDNPAQKKAVNTFHYALNEDGFLMLGKAENITQSDNLFKGFNKKYKIFSRKTNSGNRTLPALLPRYSKQNIPVTGINKTKQNISFNNNVLSNAIDAILVAEFMPASVVINHQMEIVQFRGTTELFLTHPQGNATLNILKMARPELAFELRNSISKVIKTKRHLRKSGVELKINSVVKIVSLDIAPLKIESDEPLLLIIFTEHEQTENFLHQAEGGKNISTAKDRRIKKLEQEIAVAHADALALAHEHEAFTEELQSANEEIVSSNEELQTVNEELETSKEETESANEELTVTNQELQTRNDQLNESYDYSEAIIATMPSPMVVLDKNLRVKSASKTFYKKFKVTEEETEGILLYDLGNRQWNIPRLREHLEEILPKNSHFHDFEISHTFPFVGKKIMLLNASRIVHKTSHEELILLAFADVTEVRKLALEKTDNEKKILQKKIETEQKLKELSEEKQNQLQNIFLNAHACIAVLEGTEHRYILANRAYEKLTNRKAEDLLGKSVSEVFPELIGTGTIELFDNVFETGEAFFAPEFAVMLDLKNEGIVRQTYFNFSMEPLKNDSGEIYAVMSMAYDITEQVEAIDKIKENEKKEAFLLKLSDAIKELIDPVDIQLTACRILGEHLKVNRVLYGEVIDEEHIIVNNNYVNGVPPITATLDAEQFGRKVIDAFKCHEKIIISDINTDPGYTEEEKQNFLSLDVVANAGMGLVKGGRWVATFGMHYNAPRKWTATEIWLLEETADRTWAAVVRARAEQALRKSEEKYRNLFTSIDQGFAFCELIRNKEGKGIDFCVLEVNSTYEKQAGVTAEMVVGKTILQAFPTLDKWWIETYAAVVEDQRPVVFEQFFEQSQRWLEINAYPVEKDRFAILFSDISERKQAEENISLRADEFEKAVKERTKELAEQKDKFSKLFESSPFGITLAEASTGKIIDVNGNYTKLTGYTREEIIGRTSHELNVIENGAGEITLEQLTNHGIVNNAEVQIKTKLEKIISVLVSIETVTIGEQKYFLNAINDITERKKSEREIEQKSKELENMNKELEAFNYIASHDLQSPLQKIKNFIGCLVDEEKEALSESGKQYLEKTFNTVQRMQGLINDLLSYSSIKRSELKFERTDLNVILNQVKDDLKEVIHEVGAVIDAQELYEVNIIPFQIRQLLNNLINNALKFSREEVKPHIVIKSETAKGKEFNNHLLKDHEEKLLPEATYCHISISDNGIGFDHQYNERIFEVFQRLHGNEQYKGTGIGLAICKKIVDNHNGVITATGKVNEGATFDIFLLLE